MTRRIYSPLSVSGCQLWLDAWEASSLFTSTAETTQCTNTSVVGRWKDLSGNGRHCDQATAGNKPTYQTGGLNSRPSVRFDGVDDRLLSSSFTFAQPCTIVLVGYTAGPNGYFVDGATGNNRVIVFDSTTDLAVYGGTAFIGVTTTDTTTARFYLGHFNGASSFAQQNTTAGTPGAAGTDAETAGVCIGDYGASAGGAPLSGDIAMIAFYNKALSSAEKTFLYNYAHERHAI